MQRLLRDLLELKELHTNQGSSEIPIMSKPFIDKVTDMGTHAVLSAVLTDLNGKRMGSIKIRFTKGRIGWNHELSVLITGHRYLNYPNTVKGDTYSVPMTLVDHLAGFVCSCEDFYGEEVTESSSTFEDVHSITDVNTGTTYRVYWV